MVRRCFPVAKIVGSSPTGVVFLPFAFLIFRSNCASSFVLAFLLLSELGFLVVE